MLQGARFVNKGGKKLAKVQTNKHPTKNTNKILKTSRKKGIKSCLSFDTSFSFFSFVPQKEREVRNKKNMDLLKIRNWCFDNQILLHPDKTKLLIFGSRKNIAKVNDFHVSLLGKELVPATTVLKTSGLF